MSEIAKLGYVGIESPTYDKWRTWAPEVLGCMLGPDGDDGAVRVKIDEADYRLSLHPGEQHKLAYVGWEVLSHRDLDAAMARLEKAGAKPEFADIEVAASRGVDKLVRFEDPFGQPYELFCYQESGYRDWNPPRPHAGFVTGDQGLGHVVFAVPDVRKAVDFHLDAMGFQTSDIITLNPPMGEMWFLRANPRHHSVAFVEVPNSLGLHHVYLESKSFDDVGYSYFDVLGGDECPDLLMNLGRHIGDQVISYYLHSPAGFFIEYGWGGLEIDDLERRSPLFINLRKGKRPEMWGHKFRFQPNEAVHPYES
ncbi:VOC family protein [Nocardia sp. NBC_01377]|uniref:VOC family protein n=1 Tax=Nocardia sp. NBC_01377 TaxID=2903595 RepID=UPI0032546114